MGLLTRSDILSFRTITIRRNPGEGSEPLLEKRRERDEATILSLARSPSACRVTTGRNRETMNAAAFAGFKPRHQRIGTR